MLDRHVNKIINMNDPRFTWGQKADGTWYCKEFKSETIQEADENIDEINQVLNKYNIKEKKDKPVKEKKQ